MKFPFQFAARFSLPQVIHGLQVNFRFIESMLDSFTLRFPNLRTVLTADVATALITYSDVTGLSFPVTGGKTYYYRFSLDYTVNAVTNGSGFAINGPAAPTRLSYSVHKGRTTTQDTLLFGCSTYDADTANNASPTLNSNQAFIEGFITPSVSGTVIARFLSEIAVANGVTVKKGSLVEYYEVIP